MDLSIHSVSLDRVENSVPNNKMNGITFKSAQEIVSFSKGAKNKLSNKTLRNTVLGAFFASFLAFLGFDQLKDIPSQAETAVRENLFQKSAADLLKKTEKSPEGRKKLEIEGKSKEAKAKAIISDAVDELLAENTKYKGIDANKAIQIKEKMYDMANNRGYNFRMDENAIDYAIALIKQDFKSRSF